MNTIPLTQSCYVGSQQSTLLQSTIGAAFDATVERFPDNPALVVRHQNIRWSYREYQREVERLATGLVALGIEPGDRVGIWAPNCVEWCLTQFATAKIGAVMVCINPAYRIYELEYALNKVQCKAVVIATQFKSSDYIGMIQTLAPELEQLGSGEQLQCAKLPHLRTVIRCGEDKTAGMHNFPEVLQLGGVAEQSAMAEIAASLKPDDAINIQFTSGTTGSPKGATLSHRNILNNGKVVGDGMLLTERDRLCIPVPLYHCFGMVMGNLACITHGSTAVFPGEAFEPQATLATVAAEKCTALHGVPTMFIAELDLPNIDQYDLSSLRTGIMAGSPCPVEVMKKVIEKMHMEDVLIAYGQTELSPVNHMTLVDDSLERRVSTVGRPGPHLEVRIVDEHNTIVPPGQPGEICTRGYSVMKGYWDDAEKTAETIDSEGWLHSGDIGEMDEEGYVKIVGRIKDMIIRGGENIYPREVEEFLYTHPAVQDVQVFGIPDQKYGEQVVAWIRLHDGHEVSEEQIKAYCRDKITHFKVPSIVRFVSEFPMTVTGKAQKFLMRDEMIKQLGQ